MRKARRVERAADQVKLALDHRQSLSHDHHTYHYAAAVLATINEGASAVRNLEKAANDGLPNYPAFLHDRHFKGLHEREDFQNLLGELKNRWKSFHAEFGDT